MTPKDNKLSKLVQEVCKQDISDVENYFNQVEAESNRVK